MKKYIEPIRRLHLLCMVGSCLFAGTASAKTTEIDLLGTGSTWYRNNSGISNFTVSGGTLTFRPSSTGGEAITYFASAASPITVMEGKVITLEFSYSIDNPLSRGGGLRIGLFNSNDGPVISSSPFNAAGTDFGDYTGYYLRTNPRSSAANGSDFSARNVTGDITLLSGGGGSEPGTVLTTSAAIGMASNVSYNGYISIANDGGYGLLISYRLSDSSELVTFRDTAYQYASFNAVGLNFKKTSADGATALTITDMKLSVANIPEPAHVSACIGVFVLLLLANRYRKGKAR